jgi:DNA-binding MarR family transcriptional regulator
MKGNEQHKLMQEYVHLLGKTYVILLSRMDEFYGAPLSTNEKVILQVLDEKPISIKEVSVRTGLALSTLTNVFDKMENKRLIKRRHSRKDRRIVKIERDVAGRRLESKFNHLIREIACTWMAGLPDRDREGFTSALERAGRCLGADTGDLRDALDSFMESSGTVVAEPSRKR